MIEHFLKVNQTAIQYVKHHKIHKKSFKELYHDIYKMIGLFQKNNLNPGDKVAIFILPYHYNFYITLFAGMLYQLNLVVFDSYERKHLNQLVMLEQVNYCLVDKKTKFLSKIFLPKCKKIDIHSYFQYEEGTAPSLREDSIILTTFTSGTTGTPKPIYRTLGFLKQQIEQIQNEIPMDCFTTIYGGLPIYNLLSLFSLKTTSISKKLKTLSIMDAECVLTSIQKILNEKHSYFKVKYVMLGGAILYSFEAKKIKEIFPNAQITYVYGASEGAIIYKTDLNHYIEHPFVFDTPAKETRVEIQQPNAFGVGEIVISGEKVNSENHIHYTKDLGKLVDGKLFLVGRKKYSSLEQGYYNYVLDEEIRKESKKLVFTFYHNQRIYVVSKDRLKETRSDYTYVKMKHLPMDLKHKTKLNYQECIKRIKEKNKA